MTLAKKQTLKVLQSICCLLKALAERLCIAARQSVAACGSHDDAQVVVIDGARSLLDLAQGFTGARIGKRYVQSSQVKDGGIPIESQRQRANWLSGLLEIRKQWMKSQAAGRGQRRVLGGYRSNEASKTLIHCVFAASDGSDDGL
jgi:hypothetical protein